MRRPLRIVERARSDVDHIFNWLVHRSIQGAISWYLAFYRMAEEIASSPESFAEAPEIPSAKAPTSSSAFQDPTWTRLLNYFRAF
jgi:plasmid stabilization system protein ParE